MTRTREKKGKPKEDAVAGNESSAGLDAALKVGVKHIKNWPFINDHGLEWIGIRVLTRKIRTPT
jgi:hypothetical protein